MDIICDVEFDSLTPTRIWCIVCKELETGEVHVFRYDEDEDWKDFIEYSRLVRCWIGHNFLTFDVTNLTRLIRKIPNVYIQFNSTIDTLILSRLIHYTRPGGHSLENLGKPYGLKKSPISVYDDPTLIDKYVERCIGDVEINYQIYVKEFKRFVDDPEWKDAIQLEHDLALICKNITDNGFGFNKIKAETLLEDIDNRTKALTSEIQESVGSIKEVDRVVTLRRKTDGTPDSRSLEWIKCGVPDDFNHGDIYTTYKDRLFNPASPKDRINLLNEAGWNPTEKTKTHQRADFEYSRKRRYSKLTQKDIDRWDKLKKTGWKCSEENLKTLPDDAPTGSKKLAQWLTLEGRRADLVEWLGHYRESTESVHSNLLHIGSWTHRCAHRNPNCANVYSEFHGEVKSPVDEIKDQYDGLLRSLWQAKHGKYLLGCDAEGIQLRVLAHLMGDEEYINTVSNGRKEDETDVHNVNKRALGLEHIIRDDAKTFIYAWLLGAGTGKVASILKTSFSQAKRAANSFISRFPGLQRIKELDIPRDARRGYFIGLDGRKVICNSEHLMLAGYLQNGEKIIMARANVLWREEATRQDIRYSQVNFVHDEWQTEVFTYEDAVLLGEIQCWSLEQAGKDLNLLIPLKGEYKIGRHWLDTH